MSEQTQLTDGGNALVSGSIALVFSLVPLPLTGDLPGATVLTNRGPSSRLLTKRKWRRFMDDYNVERWAAKASDE